MSYETVFDLITKFINPRINDILASATEYFSSDLQTIYRVDTATFRQRPDIQKIADRFSEWRDEIYRKYGSSKLEELSPVDAQEIVEGYYKLFLDLGALFQIDWSGELLLKLWNFGKELEKELGSQQIFTEKRLLQLAFRKIRLPKKHPETVKKSSRRIAIASGVVGLAAGLLIGFYVF